VGQFENLIIHPPKRIILIESGRGVLGVNHTFSSWADKQRRV